MSEFRPLSNSVVTAADFAFLTAIAGRTGSPLMQAFVLGHHYYDPGGKAHQLLRNTAK